jgi:energy-coupling factor transporter ATP-binding protein EcfA2
MSGVKPKVLIVGPCNSGKSDISNLITGVSEEPSEVYSPTGLLLYFLCYFF